MSNTFTFDEANLDKKPKEFLKELKKLEKDGESDKVQLIADFLHQNQDRDNVLNMWEGLWEIDSDFMQNYY